MTPVTRRTRHRLVAFVALAGAGALALSACSSSSKGSSSGPSAAGPSGSTINIGAIGDVTGAPQSAASASFAGLQAWVDWTNAHGGLTGHKVKLYTQDDQNDAGKGLLAMKTLVENDHVQAIVGSFASGAELGFADYVKSKNIPVIGGNAYTPPWVSNPMFFPTQTYFNASVWSQPYDVKQAGKTKTAFSVGESAASLASAKPAYPLAAELGVKVVYTASVSTTQPNYTAACVAGKNKGAEAWIFAGGGDPVRIAADCAQQGFHPVYVNAGATLTQTLKNSPELANEWTPEYSFPFFDTAPALATYKSAMDKYYKGSGDLKFSFATSAAWAAAIAFAQGVKNAAVPAASTVTSAQIVSGLMKIKNYTADGLLPNLDFSGTPAQREVRCFYNVKLSNHKFVLADPSKKLVCRSKTGL